MENIIYIVLLIITIGLFWIIFKLNIKKAKEIQENKELEKITNKFPENIEIANEMLDMLGNNGVKIEEAKNTGTSLYIAITSYHQEILPTGLLFSILSARENVPFPIIFELLLMEFSFELVRESGLRVPSPIGPTIRNCWSVNFRAICSFCKYSKSYINYCCCNYRYSIFCHSRFFFWISLKIF